MGLDRCCVVFARLSGRCLDTVFGECTVRIVQLKAFMKVLNFYYRFCRCPAPQAISGYEYVPHDIK